MEFLQKCGLIYPSLIYSYDYFILFRKNSIFLYSYKNIADHVPELKFDYDGCCFWVEFYQKLKYCNSLLKYKTHENRN